MAGGINRTILLGTIGRHGIEVRYANSGAAIASFSLVVPEQWSDGTMHDMYIPCEIVGKQAEKAASALEAGAPVLLDGRLAKRKKGEDWTLIVSCFNCTPVQVPEATTTP